MLGEGVNRGGEITGKSIVETGERKVVKRPRSRRVVGWNGGILWNRNRIPEGRRRFMEGSRRRRLSLIHISTEILTKVKE